MRSALRPLGGVGGPLRGNSERSGGIWGYNILNLLKRVFAMADKSDPKNARWTDDPFLAASDSPKRRSGSVSVDAGLNPYRQARIAIGICGK